MTDWPIFSRLARGIAITLIIASLVGSMRALGWFEPLRLAMMDTLYGEPVESLLSGGDVVLQGELEAILTYVFLAFMVSLGVTLVDVGLVSAIFMLLLAVGYFAYASEISLAGRRVVADLFFPSLTLLVTYGAHIVARLDASSRRRRRLESRFRMHVSPQLMQLLVASDDPSIEEPVGETREITILFTDIRGFTSISEKYPPGYVVHTLNEHLDVMVRIVFGHGGYINKYMGDGLMALFNAPMEQEDYAWQAVQTASELLEAARYLGREGRLIPIPFEYGIGVATGEVVVGNVGGAGRFEYTAIGDRVNLASRLVGMALPGQILMDERTFQLVAGRVEVRHLPGVTIKGREEDPTIYRLMGLKDEPKRRGLLRF